MKKLGIQLFSLLMAVQVLDVNAQDKKVYKESAEAAYAAANIPAENFFKNPEMSAPQLSPNGKFLAYLGNENGRMNLFVGTVSNEKGKPLTSYSDADVIDFKWKGDDKLVIRTRQNGSDNAFFHMIKVANREDIHFTKPGYMSEWIDILADDKDHFLISTNERDPAFFDVYEVSFLTTNKTLIEKNPGNVISWLADAKGNVRVAVTMESQKKSVISKNAEGKWTGVMACELTENITPISFTQGGDNNVLFSTDIGRTRSELVIYDILTGNEISTVATDPNYDLFTADFSPKSKGLISYTVNSDRAHTVFQDAQIKKMDSIIRSKVDKALDYKIVSMNWMETLFLIHAYSDTNPGSYFIYDNTTTTLSLIGEYAPWMNRDLMRPMTEVKFTSRNGSELHGYLTLPVITDKNLPTIIIPCESPFTRFSWGFDAEAQYFASRGFAVLQLNYMGTTGFGRKYFQAGANQWNNSIPQDIADAVKYMVDSGVADQLRIAVLGKSYGGYAGLVSIIQNPGQVKCFADMSSVTNMFTYMNELPGYLRSKQNLYKACFGDPDFEHEVMNQNSPVTNSGAVSLPVYITHGANDGLVNRSQSDALAETLRRTGMELTYNLKENEGHNYSLLADRVNVYEELAIFIMKNTQGQFGIIEPTKSVRIND